MTSPKRLAYIAKWKAANPEKVKLYQYRADRNYDDRRKLRLFAEIKAMKVPTGPRSHGNRTRRLGVDKPYCFRDNMSDE